MRNIGYIQYIGEAYRIKTPYIVYARVCKGLFLVLFKIDNMCLTIIYYKCNILNDTYSFL